MRPLDETERQRALQKLANYPLLARAESRSLERIAAVAEFLEAKRGERILIEGEPASAVTFVLSGSVRIYHRLEDGREFTPKILSAPNHFGDVERIAGGTVNGQSVEVLEASIVARVPWESIRAMLVDDHQACIGWLEGLASQFVYTIDADRHNVFTGLPGRVANVILSYADVFGQKTKSGVEIAFPLSREQIARQVGSVKRSVLRVLQTFQEKGAIDSADARLLIKNRDDLIRETLPRRIGLSHQAGHGGLTEEND